MYLKSVTLNNFRKFREDNNELKLAYTKLKDEHINGNEESEINISNTSSLIIGKNNVGKTSIISALEKLVNDKPFVASDFNFHYLNNFLKELINDPDKVKAPNMEFKIDFEIDDNEDIISNISPLLYLDQTTFATLFVKVRLQEEEDFKIKLYKEIRSDKMTYEQRFQLLLNIMKEEKLEQAYFNNDGQEIKDGFKLSNLIEIKSIKANKITNDNSLTRAFNEIIKYRHKNNKNSSTGISEELEKINETLTRKFQDGHENEVNDSLGKIEHYDRLAIRLTSELTHEKLLGNNILMYQYAEKGMSIPEDQYGLGYTNLVMIIAEIIKYIEKDPNQSFTSKINIISIEEPEAYMHPQMQELFIKNINAAIQSLLKDKKKYVNSQILITTHSAHLLNSKIHSGNSFNHINYLTAPKEYSQIVNLQDENITTETKGNSNQLTDLEFLKKHIKFKVSELFFSDAVIFVEGITEEVLLRYWIDEKHNLQQYYISIFNIDGAHAYLYHKLIKQLQVPTLIITDLDIKMEKNKDENEKTEKEHFPQVSSLEGMETTNNTLIHFFDKNLENIEKENKQVEDNLYVSFQCKEEYYPTSFEEALILCNYKIDLLNLVLRKTKPEIYKKIHDGNDKNLMENSRLLQHKLSNDKSEFTNRLLFELVNQDTLDEFTMPKYIEEGLKALSIMLKGADI